MILIVDDDPAVTTLLKMSFEMEGHVVVTRVERRRSPGAGPPDPSSRDGGRRDDA